MRRGYTDSSVITSDIVEHADSSKTGGQIIAINLGSDACAEHECGIDDLRQDFGIPLKAERRSGFRGFISGDLVGADVRTITQVPQELKFFPNLDGYAYLIFSSSFGWRGHKAKTAQDLDRMLHARSGEELSTAWSGRDFGIRMKNDTLALGTTVLGQIYEAFKKKDIMFFFGGRSLFANPGLVIAIRSRMPEDVLEKMRVSDYDRLNLLEVVEGIYQATGLKDKLKAAGKEYFALSPKWASEIHPTSGDDAKSKYTVIFWLNPYEQRHNNCGWFTVEQLLEWAEGRGPIPMKNS